MDNQVNIGERKPIWIVLSEFYLDTELQDADFNYIARTILASKFDLEEVKQINKHEVFPVLQPNLLSVAGEWAGFNEEWLVKSIIQSLNERTPMKTLAIETSYAAFKWMCEDYWAKLEKVYDAMKSTDSLSKT